MSTIRPNLLPPQTQPSPQGGGQGFDAGRAAAAKAFFALASGKATAAAPAAAEAPAAVPAPPATRPADPAQKILRPGSLLDIRV